MNIGDRVIPKTKQKDESFRGTIANEVGDDVVVDWHFGGMDLVCIEHRDNLIVIPQKDEEAPKKTVDKPRSIVNTVSCNASNVAYPFPRKD